jgi:NAD(P)-dependent dehydrogenase (short-subunit alcohol dehydrogenase family)
MQKKVALITGGTRGIGFGISHCLAKEGFDLAVNGVRDEKQVIDQLDELKALGADVLYCQGDIGSEASRRSIYDQVRTRYGRLNILVNNAGVAPRVRKDMLETTVDDFDYVVRTNLYGAYFMCQEAANWLISQKTADATFEGCIINISSISATMASVNRGEYCVAKAGLSMATLLFATRLGEYDIPVYEIRPGVTATDMTAAVKDKYDKMINEGLCVQPRWGLPRDVGLAAAALARGDFPYSTGQVIMVDGGLTIPRL